MDPNGRPLAGVDDAPPPISWQQLREARRRMEERWPSPLRLPLVKRPSDVLYAHVSDGMSLLDVGSGDATRRDRVHALPPKVRYVSVEPDADAGADHPSLESVNGPFDAAVLFEVLEHVAPDLAVEVLRQVRERLAPQGILVVSVPCTHTPGRFLRDCTHITPWAHDELGAALVLAGYRVELLHRTYAAPALQRAVRVAFLGPVGHLFGLDYAHSVVAVARRPE